MNILFQPIIVGAFGELAPPLYRYILKVGGKQPFEVGGEQVMTSYICKLLSKVPFIATFAPSSGKIFTQISSTFVFPCSCIKSKYFEVDLFPDSVARKEHPPIDIITLYELEPCQYIISIIKEKPRKLATLDLGMGSHLSYSLYTSKN